MRRACYAVLLAAAFILILAGEPCEVESGVNAIALPSIASNRNCIPTGKGDGVRMVNRALRAVS